MWRLIGFGGLSLTGDGDPGPAAGQRRPLSLLALLAVAGDAGLSRDKLLPYLWPESDEERGRNALRQILHGLRRDLKEPELFRGTTVLSLDPSRLGSDIAELEGALAGEDLERTAELYRGAFLDGFHLDGAPEFSYWVDLKRADYAARVASTLKQLARRASESGDGEAALHWWRRLAVMDPLDSGVALELMKALAVTGNSAGALQHARIHETLLREELGGQPDPAVAAFAARLRVGAEVPTPKPAPPVPKAPDTPAGRSAPGLRERLQTELAERYQLEQELPQRGGTTRTFIARDTRHSRLVAIRVLHPSLSSALDVERFLREIALMGRLQHPGILPLLDSGEIGGQPWFAVANPAGETLRERLARVERLPRDEAIRIGIDVAGALDHAHRQEIVHRDLKPENILLVDDRAVIANFGVARALDQAANAGLTATGILMGSPGYMSPEQATTDQPLDGRSDVYSLGCILYEMLTGEPVHTGPTPQAILMQRMASERQPSMPAVRLLPTGLGPVIERSLAPLPADRYRTAGELAEALKDPDVHRPTMALPEAGPVARRGRVWVIWAGVTLFLLLLVAVVLYSIVR